MGSGWGTWGTGVDTGLAAALRPIVRLAVEVFGPCSAAAVDVVEPWPEGAPLPPPALTVATDHRLVELHATAYAMHEGPAAAAIRSRDVVVDELPSQLGGRWDLLADDAGLASAVSHPLVDEDAPTGAIVIGVLTLYGAHRPSVRTIDRKAIASLAAVACTTIVQASDPDRVRDLVSLDQLVLDLGVAEIDLRDPDLREPSR
jgi:hypothetical protein